MSPLSLIERLVMTLEEAIKNKQKIETFKEMLLSNNAKIEYKIDEITYVMNTAAQHKEEIVKNSSFPVLCSKLCVQIRSVLLDKFLDFQDRKEWFCRYSIVLMQEIDAFYPIITKISKSDKLQSVYAKELVFYYGIVIGLYRFLEGVSWGYSTLLTHKELDNDNLTNIKVLYNFMVRLKRFFLVKKEADFSDCKPQEPEGVNDFVNNEVDFLRSIDHEDMENLVKGNVEPDLSYSEYYEYLKKLDDEKVLSEEKEIIHEFASHVVTQEINVKSIEDLQKKKKKQNRIEPVTIPTEESKEEPDHSVPTSSFPSISSQNNFLAIRCSERVNKLITNYVSKFSSPSSSKTLVSITHFCCPQNKMTYDCYYMVKSIINAILNKCPEIFKFFKLLDLDINVDIFYNDSETLRRDYTEIFIRFVKKLRELKLDYNILICISQADCAYIKNNLQNFIYLMRQAMRHMPPYLKFVLTLTGDSIIELDEISRILLLNSGVEAEVPNELHVTNRELFTKYGEATLDLFLEGSKSKSDVMDKCDGDYERLLDVGEMFSMQIREQDMIKTYDCKLASYLMAQMTKCSETTGVNMLLRVLCCTQMPIEIPLLATICGFTESKLTKIIQKELKEFIWTFRKRTTKPIEEEKEEGKFDDEIDTSIYAVISSPSLCSFDNPVDVHNDIVRVLRKTPVCQYSQYCLWFHVSECDEDYTKDYLEEDHPIEPENLKENSSESEAKLKNVTFFDLYDEFFRARAIYQMVEFHRGFDFLINELGYVISSNQTDIIEKERSQLLNFRNVLYLIEQTIKNEKLNYADFCAQLRGRLIGEEEKSLMYKLRIDITNQRHTYFKGFQNTLRENAKIETILKFPFSVNRTCLFTDQRRVAIFSDSGLIYICGIDFEVISIVSCPYPETERCCYFSQHLSPLDEPLDEDIEEEEFLFTAGNDPYVRKWELATQREVAHYQLHKSEITLMENYYEFLFTTGSDNRLVKFNIEKEKIDRVYKCKDSITAIRILDNIEDRDASKVLISTTGGYLELLDFDLGMITSLSVTNPTEFIISLINHSLSEFLSFSKDGQITVYDQETLSIIKEESILNLKSDDYLDLILIRSKEYILFTLERQKMDFFTCATFKKTDSWDYFFDQDLHHCDQNYEGSKILISDKGGYVTLFNFLKNADPNSKGMQLSCNRRNDPVACLEITHGLEQDKIVSCSNDRDLRIWRKEDGIFSKKYDLSSFTNESITSMRLGKDQNMLFLGSKDMNVYLIDIGRGKLCVVYEGHWNKVNIIHTIPERDILITVSESNIKVWDLEYDECIKNMNDHEASIVHVSQYEQKSQQHILTIGSNFEMRMWNYETGEDSKEHKLNIDTTGKVKTVFCACNFNQLLFLATNKNILVYAMETNEILHEFKPYNGEQVIEIYAYKSKENYYLIVTTRTSCVAYDLHLDGTETKVEKICGYYLNAKQSNTSKYKTNFRFYFTSCKITPLKSISKTELKKQVAGQTFTGLLDNTVQEGHNFDHTHSREIDQDITDVQEKVNVNDSNVLTTRMIDSAREKIRQEVLLVCLGDSKGYLHFNHLYLN